jgi:predicted transcriptional regulator
MTKNALPARKQQNFRLDAPTRKALEILAEKEKRSQGQIIELAVDEYFINHYKIEDFTDKTQ